MEIQFLNEEEYKSDITSTILFEDEHSFSFAKIEIENICLKFAWNSKGIEPGFQCMTEFSAFFIGVDTYIVGYDYKKKAIIFFLNIDTNFKWFDVIINGIAVVAETEIILLNTISRCTLRNCFFFRDVIMGTKVEKDKMIISFLSDDDKIVNT